MYCFMCTKNGSLESSDFLDIETNRVSASEKLLPVVLQHLANCIKVKLVFKPGAKICKQCFLELEEYDNLMLQLMTEQKRLTNQLQTMLDLQMKSGDSTQDSDEQLDLAESITEQEFIKLEGDELVEEEDAVEGSESEADSEPPPHRKRGNRICEHCGKKFKSKVELQKHITLTHDTTVHVCHICGAVRRDEEKLELHMNVHEGKTENDCRYCPKRFSRPVNALRHMRKHWDKKAYQCEKCGERFSLDNMLYNHKQLHLAEENPIICSICNQSFKSRKTFNHHVLIHQENRPRHQCSLCSKSFTERYTLKMHMKTHTDVVEEKSVENSTNDSPTVEEVMEEDETCIICSTKFETKEALDKHLQSVHDVILKKEFAGTQKK